MEPVKWCRGVGPFQALCERGGDHEGKHEGHDAHGNMFHWEEKDYPTPGKASADIPEVVGD